MTFEGSRVLITGARGMLAADLLLLLQSSGAQLILTDLHQGELRGIEVLGLDITKRGEVRDLIVNKKPDVVFNCAAYTAVDAAEDNLELAFSVNAVGPENLALACREIGTVLVHVSSDYVFGGDAYQSRKNKPYVEDESPSPCGIYGHSKRFGDELVAGILPNQHIICRTSWLHGVHGPSFVATIAKVAKEKDELRVVSDQVGSPTWAPWLAATMLKLVEKEARGTFHTCSRGDISWFDFAKEIVALTGAKTNVLSQTTAELGRKARRPAYSTMSVEKLEKTLSESCPSWKEGLKQHLDAIGALKV